MNKDYAVIWESYYQRHLRKGAFRPFWEVEASEGVAQDYTIFKSAFENGLSVLDFGCGTGIQSLWLKSKYDIVIGVDVSQSVIEKANNEYSQKGMHFRTADISRSNDIDTLKGEFGNCNVYIRGVLHQIKEEDYEVVTSNLEMLIGQSGSIFVYEVADNIKAYISEHEPNFKTWPPIVQKIFLGQLPPNGVNENVLNKLFPDDRFEVIYSDKTFLKTELKYGDGKQLHIPCLRALIRKSQESLK